MYKRGRWWWMLATIGGKEIRRSLKTTDRFVAQQKEAAILRALGLREAGIETYGETRVASPVDLIDEYVMEMTRRGRAPRHVRQTQAKLLRLLGRASSLEAATPESIRHELAAIGERTSARTANFYRGALSAFFNWLVLEGRWGENPVKRVAPARVTGSQRVRRSLSEAERDRLLAAAPLYRSLVYRFVTTTGLRRGEVRSLRWADIDLGQGTVTIRAKYAKNRRETTLPLVAGTVAALRAAGGPGSARDLVFPRVPNMDTLRRDLQSAGIEYRTAEGVLDFHALRTSFGTLLARAGVSLAHRQVLMRHSDPKLTAGVYTRLEAADTAAALERIDPPGVRNSYGSRRTSAHSGASEGAQEPRRDPP